jgi:hypothetical protein
VEGVPLQQCDAPLAQAVVALLPRGAAGEGVAVPPLASVAEAVGEGGGDAVGGAGEAVPLGEALAVGAGGVGEALPLREGGAGEGGPEAECGGEHEGLPEPLPLRGPLPLATPRRVTGGAGVGSASATQ